MQPPNFSLIIVMVCFWLTYWLIQKFLLKPDLTFWFDISVEESQERLAKRNKMQGIENCRLESEDSEFFNRVIQAYRELCQTEPDRFIHIPAEETRSVTQKQLLDILIPKLESC